MADEDPVGEKYIVGRAEYDPMGDEIANAKTYTFDIIKEADFLTATCPELHIILSAPDWESLEDKINEAYIKYETEK